MKRKQTPPTPYQTVQDALYRMACGYTTHQTKFHRELVREFDPATGKKIRETETAVPRSEELHIPASVMAARYYLESHAPPTQTAEEALVEAAKALLERAEEEGTRGTPSFLLEKRTEAKENLLWDEEE